MRTRITFIFCLLMGLIGLTSALASQVQAVPNTSSSFQFLKNQFSLGGYNKGIIDFDFKPKPPDPIFFEASNKADNGLTFMYQRMLWHSKYFFSINLGSNFSYWSKQSDNLFALSTFIAFRIWPFHTQYFNPYFTYSIAGPTLISTTRFGRAKLGKNVLFQDFIGVGALFGHNNAYSLSALLVHYSNGDIFVKNSGFDVPLVISFGYVFGKSTPKLGPIENSVHRRHGFFIGAQFGWSSADYSSSTLKPGFSLSSISDEEGDAYHVFFGYNFNRFIAAESGVIYFSQPTLKVITATGSKNFRIKNNIVYLVATLSSPEYHRFAVFGKAGVGYIVRDGIKIGGTTVLREGELFTPVYGAGLTYHMLRHWVIDASWMQSPKNNSKQLVTSNYYGLGVIYRFWG